MSEILLVDRALLEDAIEKLGEAKEALERIGQDAPDLASTIAQLSDPQTIKNLSGKTVTTQRASVSVDPEKKYKVSTWDYSYADVAYEVMPEGTAFDTDFAWNAIEPIIETKGKPRRSSLVRSMKGDSRFKLVGSKDSGELMFRKIPTDQLEIEGG